MTHKNVSQKTFACSDAEKKFYQAVALTGILWLAGNLYTSSDVSVEQAKEVQLEMRTAMLLIMAGDQPDGTLNQLGQQAARAMLTNIGIGLIDGTLSMGPPLGTTFSADILPQLSEQFSPNLTSSHFLRAASPKTKRLFHYLTQEWANSEKLAMEQAWNL